MPEAKLDLNLTAFLTYKVSQINHNFDLTIQTSVLPVIAYKWQF